MTTVVNNPGGSSDSGGGMGFLAGIILLVVVVFLFIIYGLPAIRQGAASPQINVPDQIDVNVEGNPPVQPEVNINQENSGEGAQTPDQPAQ